MDKFNCDLMIAAYEELRRRHGKRDVIPSTEDVYCQMRDAFWQFRDVAIRDMAEALISACHHKTAVRRELSILWPSLQEECYRRGWQTWFDGVADYDRMRVIFTDDDSFENYICEYSAWAISYLWWHIRHNAGAGPQFAPDEKEITAWLDSYAYIPKPNQESLFSLLV